ncbi:hypothetical protein CAJCM15448_44280 [Candidozyma auris]|nr:hypothetical protein CAJCM15448_44280 [[Candida] auris]
MTLEGPIEQIYEKVRAFLVSANVGEEILAQEFDFDSCSEVPQLAQLLNEVDFEEHLSIEGDEEFKKSVRTSSKEFIRITSLTKVVDDLISGIQSSSEVSEVGSLPEEHVSSICKLALLLEWHIYCIRFDDDATSSKADFFTLLQLISESLFAISTKHISRFWEYLESRIKLFKQHVFDKNITSHRIALLGLCNGLTDKYYIRNSFGKLDSYVKDTFNDEFQARVRLYLATMLSFEDSTGLNKYFAIANRENKEPAVVRTNSPDDNLLEDLLSFYRLSRNPFYYLRSPRLLHSVAVSMDKFASYLMEQEAKYAVRHPGRDIFAVTTPQTEQEVAESTEKSKRVVFFPETYWLTPFESRKDEKVKLDDQKNIIKKLDSSSFRRLLLIHIYLVCSFFVALSPANKRSLLKTAGAPANVKHISEEFTPDASYKIFLNNKRDIPKNCLTWDSQLSNLLSSLSQSEEHWWAWLLYGKDRDGNLLLTDKNISDEELAAVKEKHSSAVPFKTKRYFNTHATPQLSRKMKTKTGLHLLERRSDEGIDYSAKIEELKGKIEHAQIEGDVETVKELTEAKTILLWKHIKAARQHQWLHLGKLLSEEDLGKSDIAKDVEMEDATVNGEIIEKNSREKTEIQDGDEASANKGLLKQENQEVSQGDEDQNKLEGNRTVDEKHDSPNDPNSQDIPGNGNEHKDNVQHEQDTSKDAMHIDESKPPEIPESQIEQEDKSTEKEKAKEQGALEDTPDESEPKPRSESPPAVRRSLRKRTRSPEAEDISQTSKKRRA